MAYVQIYKWSIHNATQEQSKARFISFIHVDLCTLVYRRNIACAISMWYWFLRLIEKKCRYTYRCETCYVSSSKSQKQLQRYETLSSLKDQISTFLHYFNSQPCRLMSCVTIVMVRKNVPYRSMNWIPQFVDQARFARLSTSPHTWDQVSNKASAVTRIHFPK